MVDQAPSLSGTGEAALSDAKIYDVLYKHRYSELDGLRGIASLVVGIGHGLSIPIVISGAAFGSFLIGATCGVVNGAIAVDLFFIMSGFFLSGMLETLRVGNLRTFYLRRFVRLVPPAVASVVVLYLYARITLTSAPTYPEASPEFLQFFAFNRVISHKILLLNLALIRHTLNPPLWTIRLELFTSAIFPLVYFMKEFRDSAGYKFALLGVFLSVAVLLHSHQKLGVDVFHYLYIFYAGALVRDFGAAIRKISVHFQYALFAVVVLALCLIGEFDPLYGWHPILFDLPTTIFGAILVALLGFGNIASVRRVMNGRVIQFLGRISYSFYLMNWLVVMGAGALVMRLRLSDSHGAFTAVLIAAGASVLAGIGLGYLLHIMVERPSVALSRYLGTKFK